MTISKNNNDLFLRKLVKKTKLDKAPDNFTSQIMNRITVESAQESVSEPPLISINQWIFIILGFVALIFLVFFVDWSFLGLNMNTSNVNEQSVKKILLEYQQLLASLKSAFSFLTQSKIPAIVMIGMASLVVLDRLLKRISPGKSYIF